MILFLGITLAIVIISALISLADKSWKRNGVRHRVFLGWVIVLCSMWFITSAAILGTSYDKYLDERAFYDATVEQYASAVVMYGDMAVIDVESAAWTDLKYQGYQDNVSGLIIALRNRIIKYNNSFVRMNKMHSNPFFSWLVVSMDDDMKLIKMKTASQR